MSLLFRHVNASFALCEADQPLTTTTSCRSNCERVAAKFVENEFEKADRLIEIFFQYQRRVKAALERLKRRDRMDQDEDIDAELRDAGHFMLQQVRYLGFVAPFMWTMQAHLTFKDTENRSSDVLGCVKYFFQTATTSCCERGVCRPIEVQNINTMMMMMIMIMMMMTMLPMYMLPGFLCRYLYARVL